MKTEKCDWQWEGKIIRNHRRILHAYPQFSLSVFFFLTNYYFILINETFWLHWAFAAACGLPPVAERGLLSTCGARASHCAGFSLQSTSSRLMDFVGCSSRALECGLQLLWHTGLVVWRHMASSRTRDRTQVPCTGKWILDNWATRKVCILGFQPDSLEDGVFFYERLSPPHLPKRCIYS